MFGKTDVYKNRFPLLPKGFKIARSRTRVNWKNRRFMIPRNAPNEADRVALAHYIHKHIYHGNFQSPIDEALQRGIKVIDVSCGTGIWTLEMARDFPNSTFVGTHAVDQFPSRDIPPNCTFVRADTLKGLPFEDGTFDYTFQRKVNLTYTLENWERVVGELARVTKSGGWVELVEDDGIVHRAPKSYSKYEAAWLTATRIRGIDIYTAHNLASLLTGCSLEDVESDYVSVTVGWQDRLGELMGRNLELYRLGLKKQMAPLMDMKEDEYERWAVEITREIAENRGYINGYYAYGKKP